MIKAVFMQAENNGIRLCIDGHAPKSTAFICPAVSGIFYALSGYLANRFGKELVVNAIRSGHADIVCSEEAKEFFKMACMGFLQMAEKYPGSIEVKTNVWESELCSMPELKEMEF